MKLMIASDIHGSMDWCRRLLAAKKEEQPDKLLLLGDLLYHGPRNALPDGYAPQEVAAALNAEKKDLICVRGNCEAEVDQMMLEFPVLAEYALLYTGSHMIFATHGHHFNIGALPCLQPGEILLYGHTHVPLFEKKDGIYCVNPGSISIPKNGSAHSYLILEGDTLTWKSLESAGGMPAAVREERL